MERRHEQRVRTEGERPEEQLWKESAARHAATQRERNRWAWVRAYDRMARNHAALAEDYRRRADQLMEG